jgi:hypothetical protein
MAGAFDDDVGVGDRLAEVSAVKVRCSEPADHLRFAALGDLVEHVGGVTALGRQLATSRGSPWAAVVIMVVFLLVLNGLATDVADGRRA